MYVLGISCYYHDAAACLTEGEEVIAAAEEERFTREKHDSSFPNHAIRYCLSEAGITIDEVDFVGFYEKPILKFDRILETLLTVAPRGFRAYMAGIPLWMRNRLWIRDNIRDELGYDGEVVFSTHHQSHASSAFFASPFEEAAFLTVDGVGEWNTTTWGVAENNTVDIRQTIDFPHSLGLLYSAFTYYLGFRVNNGEYKVMGLSAYGEPEYEDVVLGELIDVKPDGSFRLNTDYFGYLTSGRMVNRAFIGLFDEPRREPDGDLTSFHFDVAASIQSVTERVLLRLVNSLYDRTNKDNLCLAGGVALNSVANGRILRETPFEDTFIQPAAGDDGGAYGVAASVYHQALGNPRTVPRDRTERMKAGYLGPRYGKGDIRDAVDSTDVAVTEFESQDAILGEMASLLAAGNVIGIYQGRMEWGPRALGNRSILADPRDADMQDVVNQKIKFREGFRPFAPTVLVDHASEYFEAPRESPYMLQVFDVLEEKRDVIPAVTHVDGTSRIQTIARGDNPAYYDLIEAFRRETGVPVVLNTSLNRRGEPIVCTPAEALTCLTETEMDFLCFPEARLLANGLTESDPVAREHVDG